MLFGLLPLALVLAVAGALLLRAAYPSPSVSDVRGAERTATLPGERLAARMTDGFERTAHAVDVLVDPRPGSEVLRTRESDPEQQRATYVVVGGALLGLAVVLVLGLWLVLAA